MNYVSLGGVALNGAMIISDRSTSYSVAQSMKRTLGGNVKLFFAQLTKGQNLTLTATEDQGWITKDMVDQIMALAESAGGVYELLVNGVGRSVVFRHHDAPAFEASPLVYRNNQQADDLYTCTIKLMTV